MAKILIIDDDPFVCKTFVKMFTRIGHGVNYALSLKKGLDEISAEQSDIVFLDVNLPDGNGLDAIELIREYPFAPEIIIMTGESDPDGAELAMQSKAWDYIEKGGSYKKFQFSLDRALEYRRQKKSNTQKKVLNRDAIIGESPLISKCLAKVSMAATNDLSVLLTGKTGTGKELFSRAIHQNSKRSQGEFVVVDCAALPEHLVESTLFGHTKGAFTGAEFDKTGLMKMADNGTLFLDEVGELPLNIQKKFLRALQEKKFRPVGSKNEVESNFRLICATHCDLNNMVEENTFREDLFFRIYSIHIHLPSLKNRGSDIKALVENHLSRKRELFKEMPCKLSGEFLDEIQAYDWPGNVRELINTIDLVYNDAGPGNTLFPHHLPGHIRAFNIRNKFEASASSVSDSKNQKAASTFKEYIEKMKIGYLRDLLAAADGNIPEACKRSGLSKSQLYRLMQQYELKAY